jgi:phospholipase C
MRRRATAVVQLPGPRPQNIVTGEAQVVRAVGASPRWPSTLLAVMYDEHGGYYDHVPPPPALPPDTTAPLVDPGESSYGGFGRYGFRVPSVVASPYARRNHVGHVLHDHTSVLTDFLDLGALATRQPTFPALPPR